MYLPWDPRAKGTHIFFSLFLVFGGASGPQNRNPKSKHSHEHHEHTYCAAVSFFGQTLVRPLIGFGGACFGDLSEYPKFEPFILSQREGPISWIPFRPQYWNCKMHFLFQNRGVTINTKRNQNRDMHTLLVC